MEKQIWILFIDKIILKAGVAEEEEIEDNIIDVCHYQHQSHNTKINCQIKTQQYKKLYFLLNVIRVTF